jgi:hypothetical protein
MEDYRLDILRRLQTILADVEFLELPDDTREFLGSYDKLETWIEYPAYLGATIKTDYQIILGFGDANPTYWDGTLHWSFSKDFTTTPFFSGEIRNGSPEYVIWELFYQLNEEIKKGANK